MSSYICLDTSVLVKVLVEEEDSVKATSLMQKIIQDGQLIVLPSFAWNYRDTIPNYGVLGRNHSSAR